MSTPLEQVPPDEAAAIADLVALQRRLMDPQKPQRGQHAKGHGLVRGTFAVRGDVPDAMRVGLFATPASYDCWVRFSNGFSADDRQPDVETPEEPRGLAHRRAPAPGPRRRSRSAPARQAADRLTVS